MPEQDNKTISERLRDALRLSTLNLIERKIKLGEPVVTADSNGLPHVISASEALQILYQSKNE